MGLIEKANGKEIPLGALPTTESIISYTTAVEQGLASPGQGERIGGLWNHTKLIG